MTTQIRSTVAILVGVFVFSSVLNLPARGQWRVNETNATESCSYDHEAMLALDQQAFDQDMNGGWREIARREGCMEVAADLIREYRETHDREELILYWHEGQLRAILGATTDAIELFEKSYDSRESPFADAWNLYVDATIAFLRKDKSLLLGAREALVGLPPPEPIPDGVSWPLNLNVVEMLVACFEREYEEAYGRCAN